MAVVLVVLEPGCLLGFQPYLLVSSTVVVFVTGFSPLILLRSAKCHGAGRGEEMCLSLPASSTVFSTITTPIKAWIVSNERLKTYVLNRINRMYK